MSERFLTQGTVVEDPLGGKLPQERVDEIYEICNFARIKYVFKASKTDQSKKNLKQVKPTKAKKTRKLRRNRNRN
jgi:uncharacterized protein YutD